MIKHNLKNQLILVFNNVPYLKQCRAIWADVDRTDKPIAQPFLQNNARHSLNICDHILP
jgi:hypothetical protein